MNLCDWKLANRGTVTFSATKIQKAARNARGFLENHILYRFVLFAHPHIAADGRQTHGNWKNIDHKQAAGKKKTWNWQTTSPKTNLTATSTPPTRGMTKMADNKSLTAMRTMYKLVVVRWGLKCKSACSMIKTKCSKLITNRLTRRSQRDYENDVHRPLQFNSGNCLQNCNEARFLSLCFGCDAGLWAFWIDHHTLWDF